MQTAKTTTGLKPVETPQTCVCTDHPWMTVPEAALALGKSREYLYAGLRLNQFPGAKFGRSWNMPRAFIRSFVADVIERGLSLSFEDYAAAWIENAKAVA